MQMSHLPLPIAGSEPLQRKSRKITIVGVGTVGMAAAYAIMIKELATEIALIDAYCDRVKGEVMDLTYGGQFVQRCKVTGSTEFSISANSDIVFVTSSVRQRECESRTSFIQRNVDIFKEMIPQIVKHSPQCILVIVSEPVDILTYVAAKLSGFPPNRLIGTGTMLDSARFRALLGDALGLSASNVHALIIGEHGESSVPVWSNISATGVPQISLNPMLEKPCDPQNFISMHKNVVESAHEITKLKGATSWASGLMCCALASAILNDAHIIYPLTTSIRGNYDIQDDVYMSLPVLVTSNGADHVVPLQLTCDEQCKLKQSVDTLLEVYRSICWC